MSVIYPVILSGGAGTRLWPLSREMYPKQLLALTSQHSMLQDTALRLAGIAGCRAPLVVCNEAHRFTVAEQLRTLRLEPAGILLEPIGRNTVELAESGKLVTFGIVANAPETGYGYIHRGPGEGPAYPVAEFIEKPPLATAEKFLAAGDYYWNSGMFVFKAGRFLTELGLYAPDLLEASTAAYRTASSDLDFVRIGKAAFEACRSESIDYAVMEKTQDAVVLPLDAGWSDVGSWSSLFDALPANGDGNVLQGDVLVHDTHDCYVHSTSRLVATVGMADHIIVETKDAILVAPKHRVQDVKELVMMLKKAGRSESAWHREVYRPWGSYDSIDDGDRFQVKHMELKPGGSISLQMHHHRAEHWIVVQGTAKVTCNDKSFLLSENESTYVPIGAKHRIENPGKVALHIVEVRSGTYMGEDDIVRFEDNYGREGTSN
jgi:mannose-1-phosphate guanylyltransferase/mannose-6-phosphate isomerase